jgi:hypothetical protein
MTDGTIHGAASLWCSNRRQALLLYGPIGEWDTSAVTNMARLFAADYFFNDDIGGWDVSQVTNMEQMFFLCIVVQSAVGQLECGEGQKHVPYV